MPLKNLTKAHGAATGTSHWLALEGAEEPFIRCCRNRPGTRRVDPELAAYAALVEDAPALLRALAALAKQSSQPLDEQAPMVRDLIEKHRDLLSG